MNQEQEYISGLGKNSVVPPEIKGWNWGAFLLNWVWGIGNSTYIAFLMFVPLVNIVMFFVLGAKGNEWAWKNRVWRDVKHFKNTQRKWRNAGLILLFVIFPLLFMSIGKILKGEAFDKSLSVISANEKVIELIGTPIEAGYFVMGSIQTSGPDGEASLQYSVVGPKGSADVYVLAFKKMEKWSLDEVVVYSKEFEKRIQVVKPKK
jgi:Cytochrome oxidase complex assembly protein 1